jgi:hypothetical protein
MTDDKNHAKLGNITKHPSVRVHEEEVFFKVTKQAHNLTQFGRKAGILLINSQKHLLTYRLVPYNRGGKTVMISGATAQTGHWPPFTGFMTVCIVRCGVISSTIDLF